MKHHNVILVAISSVLLGLSYIFPNYGAFLIFLFLIPLFFLALQSGDCSPMHWFFYGVLWGIIFFTVHWITLFPFFIKNTSGVFRLALYPLVILYASLWSGLWFFISAIAPKRLWFSWIMGTMSFLYVFMYYSLVPLGFKSGYPFINPLVVLAANDNWCHMFSVFNELVLLLFIIISQMGVAYIIINNSFQSLQLLPIICLCLVPFVYGYIKNDTQVIAPTNREIIPINIHFSSPFLSYLDHAQEITNKLINVSIQYPDCSTFVMPETIFPFNLNQLPDVIAMWTDNVLYEDKVLLIGSNYINKEGRIFNVVYAIQRGRIIYTYFKKHLVPYIEYLPLVVHSSPVYNALFFNKKKQYTPYDKQQGPSIFVSKNIVYNLMICSEFFLCNNVMRNNSIILCVNDSWAMPYFRYIMYLYAKLHTLKYQNDILYAGCFFSEKISKRNYCA